MFPFDFKKLLWLVPITVAAVKLTRPTTPRERNLFLGIGAVGAIGLLSGGKQKPTDDEVYNPVPVDPSKVDQQLVQSIVSDLESTLLEWLYPTWPRCDSLHRYYTEPNDEEFKAISNRFLNQNKQSIRKAIMNTWDDGCGFRRTEWSDKVIERLNQLQIA